MRALVPNLYRAADLASQLLSSWDGQPYQPITDRETAIAVARTVVEREDAVYAARLGLNFCSHEAVRDLIVLAAKVRLGQKTIEVDTTKLEAVQLHRILLVLQPPTRTQKFDALNDAIRVLLETSRRYFNTEYAEHLLEAAIHENPGGSLFELACAAVRDSRYQ